MDERLRDLAKASPNFGLLYRHQPLLSDGRIQVESGETFGSLSAAGEFVLQRKACPGWNFWHAELGDRTVRLVDVRREALEKGLV